MRLPHLAGAVAIAMAAAFPALAVDVVNEDPNPVRLTITESDGSDKLELPAGEMVADVCEEKCKLTVGTSSIAVEGPVVAVIKNGKISVKTN